MCFKVNDWVKLKFSIQYINTLTYETMSTEKVKASLGTKGYKSSVEIVAVLYLKANGLRYCLNFALNRIYLVPNPIYYVSNNRISYLSKDVPVIH